MLWDRGRAPGGVRQRWSFASCSLEAGLVGYDVGTRQVDDDH